MQHKLWPHFFYEFAPFFYEFVQPRCQIAATGCKVAVTSYLPLPEILAIFDFPGTLLVRSTSLAVFVLSLGFSLSGIASPLPTWKTVIVANNLLLMAGPILYSCFSAYCEERTAITDWLGWGKLALLLPAFGYWGLIEPNGIYRSMVFSLAAVALHGRTALQLGRAALLRTCGIPTRAMALLFSTLTISKKTGVKTQTNHVTFRDSSNGA